MLPTGVVTLDDLHAAGLSDSAIRARVRSGQLRRLRPGWFARPEADATAVTAVLAGGALTCVSALRHLQDSTSGRTASGLWVPPRHGVHVRLPSNSRRGTNAKPVTAHFVGRSAGTPTRAVDPLPTALAAAGTCLPAAEWVAVADSLLHTGYPPDELLADVMSVAPHRANLFRSLMARTSMLSESGSESLMRHDLVQAGFRVKAQVQVGPDRLDLLVGDRLDIECDSVAHHTALENYSHDRARDQRLSALNYHVLRVTYHEVLFERPRLMALVRELTSQGMHLSGRVHRTRRAA